MIPDRRRLYAFRAAAAACALLLSPCGDPAEPPHTAQPLPQAQQDASPSSPFTVTSKDGTAIHGQIDLPAGSAPPFPIVVMVHGTGLFDRDVAFGQSGSERDKVFADLSRRFTDTGIAVARYDRRGVRHIPLDGAKFNWPVAATCSVETQRDDLASVYAYARQETGGEAACTILLGHSEGMAHIARLAETDAIPPAVIVGIGAPLQSPADVFVWQATQRDAFSLRMMDRDGDGRVTDAEVKVNWRTTPSAVFNVEAPFLHPAGVWTPTDLETLIQTQTKLFEAGKLAVLAMDDHAPYPDDKTPMAEYIW